MGMDDWMNRKAEPLLTKFCIEDYPGYTDAILECLSCTAVFEGLYDINVNKIICPRCGNLGVKTVREVRRIYLQ